VVAMAEYQCPECGTVTRTESVRFPFCRKCGDYLLKCRNCRHLIVATWECSHPRVSRGEFMEYSQTTDYKHIPDIDDIQVCRYHRSKIIVQPIKPGAVGWGQRLLRLGIAPLIIIALLLIGTGSELYRWRLTQLGNLEIRVSAPESISIGDQVPIRIEVLNPRQKRGRMDFTVRIQEKFFEQFRPVAIVPPPAHIAMPTGLDDSRSLFYYGVDTSQAVIITLTCTAEKQAFKKYHFSLYVGDVLHSDDLLVVGVM
jgi:predicted RNA-binding Zn-ribbon protein involved in translation (DUF1610 family)